MSGRSKNSEVSSAGNGESVMSYFETSSRQTPDRGSSPESGGDFVSNNATRFITFPALLQTDVLYKVDNTDSSTDSEDPESCDLKIEYLHRIDLIREKLASIDIANKSYFANCFSYPSDIDNRCTITEIIDDNLEIDNEISNEANKLKSTNHVTGVEINVNINTDVKIDNPEYGRFSKDNINCNVTEDTFKESKISDKSFISTDRNEKTSELIENSSKVLNDCSHLRSKSTVNLDIVEDIIPENVGTNNLVSKNVKEKVPDVEIETIFHYSDLYNTESSTELFDLNYNPPKKKFCIREKTPTIVMTKDSVKLASYNSPHLNDLDNKISGINEKTNEGAISKMYNDKAPDRNIKDRHNFAEDNGRFDWEKCNKHDIKATDGKPTDDNNSHILIFNIVDQSRSESPRSHRSIIEDLIGIIDSPVSKSKRRRIFLRSARNKVKPMDNLTLWEEIRTMEAINKSKRLESSCSKESYFQKATPNKVDFELEDVVTVDRLDVPSKGSLSSRLSSITKISKLCPFASKKKSQTTVQNQPGETVLARKETKTIEELYIAKHQKKELIPNVAETLLNSRREQDLNFEYEDTLTNEEQSDYSESEDDTVDYYQPYCLFCLCFN